MKEKSIWFFFMDVCVSEVIIFTVESFYDGASFTTVKSSTNRDDRIIPGESFLESLPGCLRSFEIGCFVQLSSSHAGSVARTVSVL